MWLKHIPFEPGQGLVLHSSAMGAADSFLHVDHGGLDSNEAMAMKGIWGKISFRNIWEIININYKKLLLFKVQMIRSEFLMEKVNTSSNSLRYYVNNPEIPCAVKIQKPKHGPSYLLIWIFIWSQKLKVPPKKQSFKSSNPVDLKQTMERGSGLHNVRIDSGSLLPFPALWHWWDITVRNQALHYLLVYHF